MGGWSLRMAWGLEACFAVFHSESASALSLLTVWSLWWNPGMVRCWRKSGLSCWIHPTPSHLWVPPEWPSCQQAQCGCWFTVKHSKAGLQTSSHPQNSDSHLLGLQGRQQTPARYLSFLDLKLVHSCCNPNLLPVKVICVINVGAQW